MTEWKEYKLENVTKRVKVGYVGSCEYAYCEPSDNAVPMIRTTNLSDIGLDYSNMKYVTKEFHEKNRKSQLHYGDILIARHGENGKASRYTSRNEANCLNVVVVEPDESQVTSLFIKYLFDTPYVKEQIRSSVVGSVQDVVNTKTIANLKVRIPAQDTVQNIVSILSSLDDKIVMNKKICENLEAQAQALFKHWFVDFAPFKEGKFVESELGMIPEGWRVGNIFDVAEIHDKKRKPLSNMQRAHMKKIYPYYGATDLMDFVEDYLFDMPLILMGEDGSVVKENGTPYIQYIWGKSWVNNHAHVMTGKNGFSTEMLIPFLAQTNIKGLVTGAVQAKLSQANMAYIKIAIPQADVLSSIAPLFDALYNMLRKAKEESSRLASLRDTLLPKLMSGEIKI